MKNAIKFLFLFATMGILFQSCSDDQDLTDNVEEFRDNGNNRGGNGGRGGNNGGRDGNNGNNGNNGNEESVSVESLDNDIVKDWTALLLDLERYSSGRPNASARAIAYIYLAAYETAVPGMDGFISNSQHLRGLRIDEDAPSGVDWEIALNRTFAEVGEHFLLNLSSSLVDEIIDFELDNENALDDGLSSEVVEASKTWGSYVAEQIIEYSQTDATAETQILDPQPNSYIPPTGDGYWTFSAEPERALFPYWESARTFVISSDETTTVPPIEYSEQRNSPYFRQMEEVYEDNNRAKANQGDQLHIAEFWSDDVEGLMMSPPARQVAIANQLIEQYDSDLQEALALFVKVGFALNDAAVSAWHDKYEYMVMRPSNYIHDYIDPDFQTNLYRLVYWPNPSFPGYPSGHSTFASAAGGIFIDFYGNETNFTDRTHEGRTEFLSTPRSYTTFDDMIEENAFSRIPLGVHVRMDCTEGMRLGYEISDAVNDLDLER